MWNRLRAPLAYVLGLFAAGILAVAALTTVTGMTLGLQISLSTSGACIAICWVIQRSMPRVGTAISSVANGSSGGAARRLQSSATSASGCGAT